VLVPSAREIAKSMTDGVPIVLSAERSEAAQAFRALGEVYAAEASSTNHNGKGEGSNGAEPRSHAGEPLARVRQLLRRP